MHQNSAKIYVDICSVLAVIDDTDVIWIAFNSTQIKYWFYLKIEQIKHNLNNYKH